MQNTQNTIMENKYSNNVLTAEKIGLKSISPSKMQSYEDCPLAFYYQHWLGLQLEQDKLHLDFGNAVQDSIEIIYSMYDNNFGGGWSACGDRLEEVESFFLKAWKNYGVSEESFAKFLTTKAGKESGYTNKSELYEEFKEDGLAILRSYWKEKEHLLVEHGLDITETEIKLWVDMHNPADPTDKLPIPFSGRIDFKTRDDKKLGDFKTSKGSWTEKDSAKKIQAKAYAFAWLMKTGNLIKDFDYVILRKGLVREDRVQVVNLRVDEADMVEFYYRVKSILLKISNREFPRGSMGHQNFCDCYKFEKALSLNK